MKLISFTFLICFLPFSITVSSSSSDHLTVITDFLHCFSLNSINDDSSSNIIYTPTNPSYASVLNFTIRNARFSTPNTPKPLLIITPIQASHVQSSVICAKNHALQIRIRSGGHDFEGLSYISHSQLPFILIDLIKFKSVKVDTESKTAWVQSGTSLGELYYSIGEQSQSQNLGFPSGVSPFVGVGGFLSGGGYGMMLRKYGLAADNVIDAHIVDSNGKVLDRKSMGEDLFWAIRGGGGGSFGVVLAWKLRLVPVPPIVTVFAVYRAWDGSNSTKLVDKWQHVAHKLDQDLVIGLLVTASKSIDGGRDMGVLLYSLYLGKADELLDIVETNLPEMGLVKENCIEMSWVEAMAYPANGFIPGNLEALLVKTPLFNGRSKTKSDFVTHPIPQIALEGIWERFKNENIDSAQFVLIPYGGKMSEISESETPSPHRAGYLYKIGYYITWEQEDADETHLSWSRELYDYMTPFVTKSPRAAYANYKDIDIGTNEVNGAYTSYEQASVWGLKYFGNNFNRLVQIKTKVDPSNFFRHEQSIPSLAYREKIEADTCMNSVTSNHMCYSTISQ